MLTDGERTGPLFFFRGGTMFSALRALSGEVGVSSGGTGVSSEEVGMAKETLSTARLLVTLPSKTSRERTSTPPGEMIWETSTFALSADRLRRVRGMRERREKTGADRATITAPRPPGSGFKPESNGHFVGYVGRCIGYSHIYT